MEPEKIDKLFRQKMENFERMPSADAWNKLQSRMEPPKKEEKKVMWLYYAAASVLLVLVSGILWLANRNESGAATQMAKTTITEMPKTGQPETKTIPESLNTGTGIAAMQPENENNNRLKEENLPVEKDKSANKAETARQLAAVDKTPAPGRKNNAEIPVFEKGDPAGSLIAQKQNRQRSAAGNTEQTNLAETGSNLNYDNKAGEAGKKHSLEILIIRETQPTEAIAVVSGQAQPEEQEVIKPTRLQIAKNVGKQLLNLKRGEKIDRTELGLPENYHIAFETNIGKQKISKSFNF